MDPNTDEPTQDNVPPAAGTELPEPVVADAFVVVVVVVVVVDE